jgi:transcription elongation GreA/GreB family factor
MTELAELQQRVKSVGARFRGTVEEDRKRSERLSSLLSLIEEGFARSQHEIKRLNEELARANEEKEQIQAMLQDLLAEGEDTGARETGTAMRELEDRINRLIETASSISGAASSDAPEMTKDSATTVNTDEDDRTAAGPEIGTEAAIRPSEELSEEAPTAAEEVEKPVRKLDSDTRETSTVIPILTDEEAEEGVFAGAEDGEEKEPLELTQMVTEEGTVVDVNADQAHPAEKDRTTLQKIIKRVSLQSGTISEEQN